MVVFLASDKSAKTPCMTITIDGTAASRGPMS